METALFVIAFLIQAGGFFGLGALCWQIVQTSRAERAHAHREEKLRERERCMVNELKRGMMAEPGGKPPLYYPAPPPDTGGLRNNGFGG